MQTGSNEMQGIREQNRLTVEERDGLLQGRSQEFVGGIHINIPPVVTYLDSCNRCFAIIMTLLRYIDYSQNIHQC